MNLAPDDSRICSPIFITVVNIGKKNLESSENIFMNLAQYVLTQITLQKSDPGYLSRFSRKNTPQNYRLRVLSLHRQKWTVMKYSTEIAVVENLGTIFGSSD